MIKKQWKLEIKSKHSILKKFSLCLSTGEVLFRKKEFLNIALKLLCKTPSEAVVESMGSMQQKHMKCNAKQTAEIHTDLNGPVVSRADHLSASLDCWFGSRKRWHFETGSNAFYTSEVVDRKKTEVSRLSYLNKTS